MESPAARLLDLLSLLQSRPHWTAPELAERLTTTTRTVRRDITRLRELGYPVDAAPGRTGGYQLGAGGALPPLLLRDDEAVAVAVGLRVAATGGVAGYDDAAVSALAKLEQVLPARLRERVLALNAAAVLVRSGVGFAAADPEVLLLLAQACRRPARLHFAYVDGAGNASERRVEPYRLVNAEQRWYLVADDLDRRAWRTFRVDRMTDPVATGHRFVRTSEPDAAAMVVEGMALAAHAWNAEVLLFTGLDDAAAEIPPKAGTLEVVDGGTLLRVGGDSLDWIARFLARLPFDFEVQSPKELRRALRDHARRLNAAGRRGPVAPARPDV
jgi:predicted DNA-binding transcriptional regulator YafY